jgi:hypothetical protein
VKIQDDEARMSVLEHGEDVFSMRRDADLMATLLERLG